MATVEPITFATLLRRHRKAAGLTQEELAERAGMSPNNVSMLERGRSQAPRKDTIALLAKALQLTQAEHARFEEAARGRVPIQNRSEGGTPSRPSATLPHASSAGLPQFVGRADELQALACHLAGNGTPLLVVMGEPGIGKSRLLHEAARSGRSGGWTVLADGCHRRSGQEPYAPLLGAIAGHLAAQPVASLRHALDGCAWLVRLLPELAEAARVPAPTWSLPPEQERRLMFGAVRRYLSNVAGPAGTLLVLDDLQWAGQDTLDLLVALVRDPLPSAGGPPDHPLRVVASYRDTEVHSDDPLAMLVADLAREGRATIHELGPLSPQEAGELATSLLDVGIAQVGTDAPTRLCNDDDLATRLAQRTGGRPYFLVSCAQAVRAARTSGVESQNATWEVPWNVSASIHQRVAALPGAARDLLGAAASSGRHASRDILMHVGARLGIATPDLLAALETTDRARLLLAAGPDGYEFAHDLVREVVAADLSPARRAVLHGWIAEALETGAKHKPHPAELAWHFQQAGEPARALPYALAAGDQAEAVYAHAEAETHYRAALELAQGGGDVAREAEALEKLGVIHYLLSRYEEAVELFDLASNLYRTSADVEGEARIAFQTSLLCVRWGRAEEGLRRLLPFLDADRANTLPVPITVQLLSNKSLLLGNSGQLEESLQAAEFADTLARSLTDSSTQALAAFQRGQALEILGRSDEALACFGRAISVSETAKSLPDLQVLVRAYNYCGGIQSQRGDWAQSALSYDAAKTYADQLGDPLLSAMIAVDQGLVAFRLGKWSLAHGCYEQARQIYQAVGRSATFYMPRFTWCTGVLCLAQGRQDEADRWFDELLALVSDAPAAVATLFTPRVAWARALDHLLHGRPELAYAQLEPFRDLSGLVSGDLIGAILEIPVLLAWTFLQLGQESEARSELTRSEAWAAASHGRKHEYVEVWRIRAMMAMRQGDQQEAETSFEEAFSLARAIPDLWAQARVLYAYGQFYAAKGELEQAREKYEQALAICERLGEGLYRPHIESALAAAQGDASAQRA